MRSGGGEVRNGHGCKDQGWGSDQRERANEDRGRGKDGEARSGGYKEWILEMLIDYLKTDIRIYNCTLYYK